jgi:hypothetical protein
MNRVAVCTVAAVGAAAIAIFDLVSAWPIHMNEVLFAVTFGLFGIAVALYGALLVVGVGERRRIIAGAANSVEVVGRAASSVRLSALAAIALSILLFANCSGSLTSGPPNYAGPMDDVSGFLIGTAEVFLPVVLVIVLAAGLATAAQVYATREQWRSARKAAQAAIWAVVTIAIVAVVTVPLGFVFLASQCFFGGNHPGTCAAGSASFTNVFMIGTFALLLPYILLMARALQSAASPAPGSDEIG